MQLELFEKVVEEQLIQPTFITDFPVEVSPLARRSADDPAFTERFELFIAGRELANGFSELNDPEDQAARFLEQAARKAAGDEEAMYFDADYVRSARIRPAADRRRGHRRRSPGHAVRRRALDPGGDPVPAPAPGAVSA